MPDLPVANLGRLEILGLTPRGVEKRADDTGISLQGLELSAWEYGSRLVPGHEAAAERLGAVQAAFAPFAAFGLESPGYLLVQAALAKSATVVLAESCTGGLAGSLVTDVPGSSDIFWGSMVTYANEAKERVLRVSTLKEHGAVSMATVEAMTQGALTLAEADASAAISGIAGPGGGTPEKPVGTVWFSFRYRDTSSALCCVFSGTRGEIRRKAAAVALAGCANQINGALLDTDWIAEYTFY